MKHCKAAAIIIALSIITIICSLMCILYLLYKKVERIEELDKKLTIIQQTLDEAETWRVIDEN